jgi:hypothetical protein
MSDEVKTGTGYVRDLKTLWVCGNPGPEIINLPKGAKLALRDKPLATDITIKIINAEIAKCRTK